MYLVHLIDSPYILDILGAFIKFSVHFRDSRQVSEISWSTSEIFGMLPKFSVVTKCPQVTFQSKISIVTIKYLIDGEKPGRFRHAKTSIILHYQRFLNEYFSNYRIAYAIN